MATTAGLNSVYFSPAGDSGAVATLKSRLSAGASVLTYGSEEWVKRLGAYSPQGQTPAFVIECATEQDVVEAVVFSRTLNLPLTARNGAHNLAELSNVQGGVIISQSPRRGITHDTGKSTVTFEGGCRFSDVDEYLWSKAPGWCMQSAMIASIGTTGSHFALGVGWLQRFVGNGIDNLVRVRVVLADGSIATASAEENPDLFFALRGAAPSFGIITEVTERIHQIVDPAQGKDVRYGQYFFALDHAEKVMAKILQWNNDPAFPDTAFLLPIFMFVNGQKGIMFWYANYQFAKGRIDTSQTRWETEIRQLAQECQGIAMNHYAPEGATDHDGWEFITHMQLQLLFAPPWCASYYPSGGFVAKDKAETVIEQVISHWRNAPHPEGAEEVPFFTTAFYHFGGRAQRQRAATAWPGNSDTNWLCATWGGWLTDQSGPQIAQRKAQTMKWVDDMHAKMRYDLQFGYICAAAFNWRSTNHAKWIHGPSFERLCEIKEKYDPLNVFNNNVNIPPKSLVAKL